MFDEASAHKYITRKGLLSGPLSEIDVYNITRFKYRID